MSQSTSLIAHDDTRQIPSISGVESLPLSLRLIADEATYQRVWSVAQAMAKSPGLVPGHLIGKQEACFTVIVASLEWKQNPMMVARCTYQTPGGGVGFMGKLVRSIAESSGYLSKPIGYEYYGAWEKVQGKFVMAEGRKTDSDGNQKKYAKADWKDSDETGIGVRVIFHMKDELEPRTFDFDLRQAHPRNSVMWATDPRTQILYTATRRAVDAVAPHLLLGMPFEDDYETRIGPDRAKDVTPPKTPDPILAKIGITTDELPTEQDDMMTREDDRSAWDMGSEVRTETHRIPIELTDPSLFHRSGIDNSGPLTYFRSVGEWAHAMCETADLHPSSAHDLWERNLPTYTKLDESIKNPTDRGHLQALSDHFNMLNHRDPAQLLRGI